MIVGYHSNFNPECKRKRGFINQLHKKTMAIRPVVPGGAGGAMAPPNFGRSVNPTSTKGGRLCPPNNTGTPGFSDLPTASKSQQVTVAFNFFNIFEIYSSNM